MHLYLPPPPQDSSFVHYAVLGVSCPQEQNGEAGVCRSRDESRITSLYKVVGYCHYFQFLSWTEQQERYYYIGLLQVEMGTNWENEICLVCGMPVCEPPSVMNFYKLNILIWFVMP